MKSIYNVKLRGLKELEKLAVENKDIEKLKIARVLFQFLATLMAKQVM